MNVVSSSLMNSMRQAQEARRQVQQKPISISPISRNIPDPAAALRLSEKMREQIKISMKGDGLNSDVALRATAQGVLGEIRGGLERMRALAAQALDNGTSAGDRERMGKELTSVKDSIEQVMSTTAYKGTNLFDGSFKADEQTAFGAATFSSVASVADSIRGVSGLTVSSSSNAADAVTRLTDVINKLDKSNFGIGDFSNQNSASSAARTPDVLASQSSSPTSTDRDAFDRDAFEARTNEIRARQYAEMTSVTGARRWSESELDLLIGRQINTMA